MYSLGGEFPRADQPNQSSGISSVFSIGRVQENTAKVQVKRKKSRSVLNKGGGTVCETLIAPLSIMLVGHQSPFAMS